MTLVMSFGACSDSGDSKSSGNLKGNFRKSTELTIIFSSDLLGKIRSCGCSIEDVGGVGRRTTYVKQIRKTAKNLLVLDVGDAFSLDLSYIMSEAELTFESFNLMGLDVFTPGEMEFIFGLPFLQSLAANAKFDIVAANIVFEDSGKPVFGPPYVVRELKGGIKVAITGVLDELVRFPGYIDRSSFRVDPTEKALKSILPAMKREADFLILLSHMGIERTEELLGKVKDFDIAIVGHGKPVIKREVKVGKTLVLGTGGLGQYIGVITLVLDPSGNYTQGRLRQVQLTSKNYDLDKEVKNLFYMYGLSLTDKELKKAGKSEGR